MMKRKGKGRERLAAAGRNLQGVETWFAPCGIETILKNNLSLSVYRSVWRILRFIAKVYI